MDKWNIRAVAASDLRALTAVIDAVALFPGEMLEGMIEGFLSGGASEEIWLTIEEGGEACAVLYCAPERLTQGTWNALLIAVHPSRQGQGCGRALMTYLENLLAERGERIVLVETSGLPDFEKTRQFYRGLGYDEEARIRDFYQAGEDKIVFRKALQATES
jgi:ribosomal protein S18 acetylase RimI-like enzyme